MTGFVQPSRPPVKSNLQQLKQARAEFRQALRDAHAAGISQAQLARLLEVSRTRVAQLLTEP